MHAAEESVEKGTHHDKEKINTVISDLPILSLSSYFVPKEFLGKPLPEAFSLLFWGKYTLFFLH